jgi:hypothetical protein
VIKASGQYSSAPGNIGVWNPLLTGEGTYVIRYNKNQDSNAYLYLPNAQAGVNPVVYQDIPTPTTILLGEQGILNISRWTYYPKALKEAKALVLLSGTLTTFFDTNYAATTDFTSIFSSANITFGARTKYFPKINVAAGTKFNTCWNASTSIVTFPKLNFTNAVTGNVNLGFRFAWNANTLLANFPPNQFDNCTTTGYYQAFNGCALTQTSVDNILVSIAQSVINTPSLTNGTLNMTGGTNATPSAIGLAAKTFLESKSWTVTVTP